MSPYSTVQLADGVKGWVATAHAERRKLRVDELNSVACRGRDGVSNTFSSALWMTDALFSLANVGVDGVNVHTLPDSAYQLFTFAHHDGDWTGSVAPVYYGMQLFAQAAPRRLPVDLRLWSEPQLQPRRVGDPGAGRYHAGGADQQEPVA